MMISANAAVRIVCGAVILATIYTTISRGWINQDKPTFTESTRSTTKWNFEESDSTQPAASNWDYEKFSKEFDCYSDSWCDTYYTDSAKTQEFIYNWQHPADCSTARFLVFPREHTAGFGSSVHVKSAFSTLAFRLNRVFIMPDHSYWPFGLMCNTSEHNFSPDANCIFEPITNCSLSLHAPEWKGDKILKDANIPQDDERVIMIHPNIFETVGSFNWRLDVPPQFKGKNTYWWHAQIASYYARPNAKTKAIVKDEMQRVFPNGKVPHPLISLYVRHGDKGSEAYLYDLSYYMNLIDEMNAKHGYKFKHIYIGTEDNDVMCKALTNPAYANYTFYFIKTHRTNEGAMEVLLTHEAHELIRVTLANLYIQTQGDVFVGTRSSNFCRLIDEIRKVQGKARVPYLSPEPLEHEQT